MSARCSRWCGAGIANFIMVSMKNVAVIAGIIRKIGIARMANGGRTNERLCNAADIHGKAERRRV